MIYEHLLYIFIGSIATIFLYYCCKITKSLYVDCKSFFKSLRRVKSNKNFKEVKIHITSKTIEGKLKLLR